jgi:iron complex transport system substrate-binding protein
VKKVWLLSLCLLFTLALPLAAQDSAEWPRTLVDGLGTEVTIDAPPERIVSLSLAVDETLLPLLGPERFAAVTALAQDPGISNVTVIANQVENAIVSAQDTEQIIALEPDIVFAASFTAPEVLQQLRDAGITVFATDYAVGLDAIRANIRLLGQVVGDEAGAEVLIETMDADIAAVQQAVGAPELPVRALFLTPGNYTSGVDSTIAEIITTAGGVDVAAAAGMDQFAALSDEFIIEQDPDVILLSGWTPYDPTFLDTFNNNPAFAGLSAVQTGRVYVANDAHLSAVSQYVSEGVADVAAYLYPDLYPTFPLTVIDASGEEVTIAAAPDSIVVAGEAESEALTLLLGEATNRGYDVLIVDADDSGIGASGNVIVFSASGGDELAEVTGADSATHVRLYAAEQPADVAANLQIIGQALGERIAALNAFARYTDILEAAQS